MATRRQETFINSDKERTNTDKFSYAQLLLIRRHGAKRDVARDVSDVG
jgi:hypothetical protein